MSELLPSHLSALLEYIRRKGRDGHPYEDLHDHAKRDADQLIEKGLVVLRGNGRRLALIAKSEAG